MDRFVYAGLAARGLEPADKTDRETLVRRVYFDLIGLPPTVAEMDAFLSDQDDGAYERLVDRLLARPEFGERWGRHWLDIVRYGDSVTLRGLIFREAWRYRDYVIDSFNNDLPFDRFIREQLAGDLLPADSPEDRRRLLTATTMLLLGNTNLENQDKNLLRLDVVDEQLDVVSKGFLAQTVTCARCHDHKFDPIPTTDYYALAGILRNAKAMEHANVSKWMEVPLPVAPEQEAELNQHQANVERLTARIKQLKARATVASAGGRGALDPADIHGVVVDDEQAKKVGQWQHSVYTGSYIGRGYLHDQNADKGAKTLTFEPQDLTPGRYEVRLAYAEGSGRARAVPVTVFSADGDTVVEVDLQPRGPIDGRFVSLGQYRFEENGQGYVMISNEGTQGHVTADAVVFVPLDQTAASGAPAIIKADPAADETAAELARLEAELKQLQAAAPKREMVMAVVEEAKIEDMRVHLRGSPANLGEVAPRGFLQVAVYGEPPSIPADQSGRKELAEWIASADNPLTARVIVNRVWHWLFGAGIVRTTDNFGVSGEPPSHPELLDYLALQFMQNGWSIKNLVRQIVLSETYQQSTQGAAATQAVDPDNRLFGRANRRRLEAEAIRDAILQVSGRLSPERGGRHFPPTLAADFAFATDATVRSVYLPYFRNALPELIAAFDPADPSTTTGRRDASTVAPQALFMLNHPFVAATGSGCRGSAARGRSAGSPTPGWNGSTARRSGDGRPRRKRRLPASTWMPMRTILGKAGRRCTTPCSPRPSSDSSTDTPPFTRSSTMWIPVTRREWLTRSSCGFGALALAGIASAETRTPPAAPGNRPHHPPKAKRVIFLFMQGGVSQVDSFDYKPVLFQEDGNQIAFDDARVIANTGRRGVAQRVMRPLWEFAQHGQCGRWASACFRISPPRSTIWPSFIRCTPRASRTDRRRCSCTAARPTSSGPAWARGCCTAWARRATTCPASSRSRRLRATAERATMATPSCPPSTKARRWAEPVRRLPRRPSAT
jgi:hypothetical protein